MLSQGSGLSDVGGDTHVETEGVFHPQQEWMWHGTIIMALPVCATAIMACKPAVQIR